MAEPLKDALDDLVEAFEAMLAAVVLMPTMLPGRVGEEIARAEAKVRAAKDRLRGVPE